MKTWTKLPFGIGLALAACALALGGQPRTGAQPAPVQGAPPTYDYDATTPGVQGPTSPALVGWMSRHLRTHQLTPGILVALDELQAALPPGFQALPNTPGADTAIVAAAFMYQVRHTCADGRIVLASAWVPNAAVRNTALDRVETLNLDFVATDAAFVEAWNDPTCGPGGARLGTVVVNIQEHGGAIRMSFEVEDAILGLQFRAAATGPAAITNRFLADPVPGYFRSVTNNGAAAGPAIRLGGQGDNVIVPAAAADLEIKGNAGRGKFGTLQLPGGRVTIVGTGPNIGFARNGEFFFAPE